jgi:hypothetical protein
LQRVKQPLILQNLQNAGARLPQFYGGPAEAWRNKAENYFWNAEKCFRDMADYDKETEGFFCGAEVRIKDTEARIRAGRAWKCWKVGFWTV